MTRGRLQPGIYFEQDSSPHPSYQLLLINAVAGADSASVETALKGLLQMLAGLTRGEVPGLEHQPALRVQESMEQFSRLDALIGYGRRFFDDHEHQPALTDARRPDFLAYLEPTRPFPALPWSAARREAEADFALQLTGLSEAAVNCAAIEVWKLIAGQRSPLVIIDSFAGYGRMDKRGWLGFHDGVSNMASEQRLAALRAPPDPKWMEGGTYMAYLRILIDLTAWESLSRDEQELLVGRDKLTGAALIGVKHVDGRVRPVAGQAPGADASAAEAADWRDPPQTVDPVLETSHIARANQSRASPAALGAFRIFRQGYDFLDSLSSEGARVGLNFVSFQRDLRVLQQLLHLPRWLGDANFGGSGAESTFPLLSVVAGGFYAVPPRAEPFPGINLFAVS